MLPPLSARQTRRRRADGRAGDACAVVGTPCWCRDGRDTRLRDDLEYSQGSVSRREDVRGEGGFVDDEMAEDGGKALDLKPQMRDQG